MSVVGVHIAIAQTVCSLDFARAKLSPRLKDLSSVLLNGCIILADSSSDRQDQRGAATDTPIPSPQQGLSAEQQQEYITELLQATFSVLGLLRMQSASNDEDSIMDTTVGAGWLFSGIATVSSTVSAY